MNSIKFDKGLFYTLLIIVGISIVPIFMLGTYAFPYYDDFNHGYLTYNALQNGANLLDVINLALNHTVNIYNSWQGTYTTIFLSTLHPGIFGEQYYFLTPIIIVLTQIISTYYFSKVLFGDYLSLNKYKVGSICLLICFFQIQNLPSAFEGYYWWASAIMHTFSYNLLLLYLGVLLSQIKKSSIIKIILLIILAILIGGSAYEIALFVPCVTIAITIILYIYNKINAKKQNASLFVKIGIITIISIIGLMINVLAPGNAIRIEESGVHVPAILAIIESFVYSGVAFFEFTSLKTILVIVIVSILTFDSLKNIKGKFLHPIWILCGIWCLYSIVFTPAIYGENYVASPRYLNVLYFCFYWFLIVTVIYCLYFYKDKISYVMKRLVILINKNTLKSLIVIILFMGCGILQYSYLDATGSCAMLDIILGNAAQFEQVNNERLNILKIDEKNVILPELNNKVRLFETDNLTEDQNNYFNKMYARYYDKDTIVIKFNEE